MGILDLIGGLGKGGGMLSQQTGGALGGLGLSDLAGFLQKLGGQGGSQGAMQPGQPPAPTQPPGTQQAGLAEAIQQFLAQQRR